MFLLSALILATSITAFSQQPPKSTPAVSGEDIVWNEAVAADTEEMLGLYLKEYPFGKYAAEAEKKLIEIKMCPELAAWRSAQAADTPRSYRGYLESFPFGRFIETAMAKIRASEAEAEAMAWAAAEKSKTADDYKNYLMAFPYGEFAALARLRLRGLGVNEFPNAVRRNSIGMEFSFIPAGQFIMGSPETEKDRSSDEGPRRAVTIAKGFWMGRYEVTQGQYEAVMGTNPSGFKDCGPDCPVETVSWNDAKEFIRRLNLRNDGYIYSLPTEAEWEYAARAGTTTAFAFGDSLSSSQANFNGNYPYGNAPKGPYLGKTVKVGSYRPNAWGLYDMHGNVWEWVEDWYTDSYTGLPTDGSANLTVGKREYRVLRGGSWVYGGVNVRSAYRLTYNPTERINNLGFRLVARSR